MHVRVTKITRKGRTYRYAQLVESYRRAEDGLPTHRIVAHLGVLSDLEVGNLRAALAASRAGRTAVVAPAERPARAASPVLANLRYLDVAVALAQWRGWGLDELLGRLLPQGEQDVAPAAVVAALTIQRCIAPGSKLGAQRWFPRTALPELLGVAPSAFNNTRLHRVLEDLDGVGARLQSELADRCREQRGAFATLFLDVTDTWFVGHGPDEAQPGKTKEGRWQRKIGIVLMCNEAGLPLRWEVVEGRQSDSRAMQGMLDSVADVSWAHQVPVVCDRAMGRSAHLQRLVDSGLRFVTGLNEDEVAAYCDLPPLALDEVALDGNDIEATVARAAEQAGLRCVEAGRYVLDRGVVSRRDGTERVTAAPRPEGESALPADGLQRAVALARQMRRALDGGSATSERDAGQSHGLAKTVAHNYLTLLRLPDDVLQEIEAGRALGLSLRTASGAAKRSDPLAQREAFEAGRTTLRQRTSHGRNGRVREAVGSDVPPLQVRAVVCFRVDQFIHQRRAANEALAELHAFVNALNVHLALPRARRGEREAFAEVHRELRRRDWVDAFEIQVETRRLPSGPRPHVTIRMRPEAWQRRRRHDGFFVLVAHPSIPLDADGLERLYRARDAVERDFHVIKSVVQLRPVRHRTTPKVRAHVTLCILALLLERTLELRLADTPQAMSAPMAFELLSTVHLNQLAPETAPVYTVTRPTPEQRALIQTLQQEALLNDEEVATAITPR